MHEPSVDLLFKENLLPGIEELGDRIGLDDAVQVAWLLFKEDGSELTYIRRLGILFFDMLRRLGYSDTQASFIVGCALPGVTDDDPAVVQLIDKVFVICNGIDKKQHAWSLDTMQKVVWDKVPTTPLISLAISLRELSRRSEDSSLLMNPARC